MADAFSRAHADVEARREAGEMGFFSLPDARDLARAVQELADGFGQWFENLVVLGIGGSALGTTTLRDALLGSFWNELDEEARDHYPRLYVLDNVDPRSVSTLLSMAGSMAPHLRVIIQETTNRLAQPACAVAVDDTHFIMAGQQRGVEEFIY